jgi:xylose isomerase
MFSTSDATPAQKKLFWACFVALVATSFTFMLRILALEDIALEFELSETQKGEILGVGIWPFAISIVLFSLVIDKIGYGKAILFAFVAHVAFAVLTVTATGYWSLYIGSALGGLAAGSIEAAINPLVATVFHKEKTKWLNILHAGWPGGLVLAGILAMTLGGTIGWKGQILLVSLPVVAYGLMMLRNEFPESERVVAGVSYREMLKEVGLLGMFITSALIFREVGRVFEWSDAVSWSATAVVSLGFFAYVRSLGHPLFVILMLIMIPLAITELGTDSWISSLMEPPMRELGLAGGWVLVYTALLMMVLRFYAGSFVHRLSPLGLLAVSAGLAIVGLTLLSGAAGIMILVAATVYGVGKTFFWPTMLGVVSEQCPRGGALTLNMIRQHPGQGDRRGARRAATGTPRAGHRRGAAQHLRRLSRHRPGATGGGRRGGPGSGGRHPRRGQEGRAGDRRDLPGHHAGLLPGAAALVPVARRLSSRRVAGRRAAALHRTMTDSFDPTPDDRFSFGLWTVGNPGADPFGGPVRTRMLASEIVQGLAEAGAWGVNLHDNDLVPFGAPAAERDRIVAEFKQALDDHGLVVPMATTNLFGHPVFRDGAFTASDPKVRAFAVRKAMRAIELGIELGAGTVVFWGGREGVETDAARDCRDALKWYRDCLDFLCAWTVDQGWDLQFALEAKPNEPRGDIYLPTTGHMLHFIETLAHKEMVGVNPEVAHENMPGLSMVHAVAQAMEQDKLFHIDLNAQKIGRYDQDLRFGSEDAKGAFFLVRLLEGTGGYPAYVGPRHFDAHAYRTEDLAGVWDFARGCMRTYKILAAKAQTFDADPEVQQILADTHADPDGVAPLLQGYSAENRAMLEGLELDADWLGGGGRCYERLDQIAMEHLLGVRG